MGLILHREIVWQLVGAWGPEIKGKPQKGPDAVMSALAWPRPERGLSQKPKGKICCISFERGGGKTEVCMLGGGLSPSKSSITGYGKNAQRRSVLVKRKPGRGDEEKSGTAQGGGGTVSS